MNNIAKEFLKDASPEFTGIAEKLIEIIESSGHNFNMAVKWKQLTFALNDDFHHWICAIALTKKSANLVFHFGGLLDDDNNIFIAGNSKFLRKIEFAVVNDINEQIVKNFLDQAVEKLQYFKDNWKELNKS